LFVGPVYFGLFLFTASTLGAVDRPFICADNQCLPQIRSQVVIDDKPEGKGCRDSEDHQSADHAQPVLKQAIINRHTYASAHAPFKAIPISIGGRKRKIVGIRGDRRTAVEFQLKNAQADGGRDDEHQQAGDFAKRQHVAETAKVKVADPGGDGRQEPGGGSYPE